MIKFEHSEALYLLFVLLPLFGGFIWFMRGRKRALRRIGEESIWESIMPLKPKTKHQVKFLFLVLGWIFLVIALANPQIGRSVEKVKREGVDLMVALDISQSMLAQDEKPSRLDRAKQFMSRLIDKLDGDRIGLIIFAGNAYLQLPLTSDYTAAKTFLKTITTELAPTQGTAIGEAIRLADNAFENGKPEYKVILVISDGENHEGDATEAAKEITEKGATIHTLGVGTPQGGPIPIFANGMQDFKRDKEGSIVFSKLNEPMLQEVAVMGNGQYMRLNQGPSEVVQLMNQLASMEQKEYEEQVFTDFEDQYQGFLLIALIFLALEYFLTERRSKIFREWSLFNGKES